MFKLQHPSDLISRLFILEYIRELGPEQLYAKANNHQKENLFYKFLDDNENEAVDINWEYCIFVATLPQLEHFLSGFLDEIETIDAKRSSDFRAIREQMIEAEVNAPTDINLMDIAKTEIENSRGKIIGGN